MNMYVQVVIVVVLLSGIMFVQHQARQAVRGRAVSGRGGRATAGAVLLSMNHHLPARCYTP